MREYESKLSENALQIILEKIQDSNLKIAEKEVLMNELFQKINGIDLENPENCEDFVAMYSVLSKVA